MAERRRRGVGFIIYGDEGVGKTTFCLQAPKPIRFLSVKETGFLDLEDVGEVPENCNYTEVESWNELVNETQEAYDCRTLIVDSLSGVQQIMAQQVMEDLYIPDAKTLEDAQRAFAAFSNGYRVDGPIYMSRWETELTALRATGTNVFIIGHSAIDKMKNAGGYDYLSAEIDMQKWPRAVLQKWAQACLYMTYDLSIEATKTWKGTVTEAKAEADDYESAPRIIYAQKSGSHSAKSRGTQLPPYIRMGTSPQEAWKNFYEELHPNLQEALKK